MKLALRLALVVLIAAALWWALKRQSGEHGVEATNATSALSVPATKPTLDEPHADPARADSTRSVAKAEAEQPGPASDPVSSGSPSGTALGLLRVHVIAFETREPLANQEVRVHPSDSTSWSWSESTGSHAEFHQAATTNSDGRAEIEVEPGHELLVDVGELNQHPSVAVSSLAAKEQREVEVAVPTQSDLTLFCRLVDAESSQAITGGLVWFDHSGDFIPDDEEDPPDAEAHAASDDIPVRSDGTFEVHARSWAEHWISAKAPEYARVALALEHGHETLDRRLDVRLSRTATLEVLAVDRRASRTTAMVELSAPSYYLEQTSSDSYGGVDLLWRVSTDATGRSVIEGVPPHIPLSLTVRAGQSTRKSADSIVLEPGEHRKIEVEIGSGATITGLIQDRAGVPLAGCPIWRVKAFDPEQELLTSDHEATQIATSDEHGRFRFEDVPPGIWLIGSPTSAEEEVDIANKAAFAGMAQSIEVGPDARELDIVLRVDRGLYLSGIVLDSQAAALSHASILLTSEIANVSLFTRSGGDGHFAIGPLPAGEYRIQAVDSSDSFAPSESVQVMAGNANVVLELRVGGAIVGVTVDASGKRIDCQLMLNWGEGRGMHRRGTRARNGTIRLEGLLPGAYSLTAISNDGLCGGRWGLQLAAAETLGDVQITLSPGAQLNLNYDGKAECALFWIRFGGQTWANDAVRRGVPRQVPVPAGDLEIRWTDPDSPAPRSQLLTLAPGETREVKWSEAH